MDLITSRMCLTKNLGVNGNLFGGDMLSFIDEAAAIFCTQYCRTEAMVTLKMSDVIFKNPVKEGDTIRIYGKMVSIGRSSATVSIEVRVQSPFTSAEEIVCTTTVVFVRIDKRGKSRPIDEAVKQKFEQENKS